MRTFSIGELQNQIFAKSKAKHDMIKNAFANMAKETRRTMEIGLSIMWYGLCSAITVYMVVKAFMIAVS